MDRPTSVEGDWTPPAGPNPSIIHQISILEAYKSGKIIEWSCNEIAWNTHGPKTPFNFGLRWYRVKPEK
jgi:hypothetical protein